MREIVCPRPSPTVSLWRCSEHMDSSQLYKLFVVSFGLLLGPFAFGHVSKTRTLQFITTVVRHVSFGLMILLALVGIARGEGRSFDDVLSYERPENITTFFGVCIYSFMCHHRCVSLSLSSQAGCRPCRCERVFVLIVVLVCAPRIRAASPASSRRSPTKHAWASSSPAPSRYVASWVFVPLERQLFVTRVFD